MIPHGLVLSSQLDLRELTLGWIVMSAYSKSVSDIRRAKLVTVSGEMELGYGIDLREAA